MVSIFLGVHGRTENTWKEMKEWMREKSLYKVPFWWNAVRERLYKMAVLLVLVMVVVVVVL